ncbi:hypothetical protein [Metapseudomonas boanensis]|uniref:Secreted protein n=1 Tax=Metapseudomonas boanensis TaxID=2822138 RepID=A0ABS5XAT3_9GAMM|nr:hypothetical protein [Pseudomonas boanensis]MBT8764806.1 hypothetical protein [Pseudomonas boanensis]
MGILFIFSVRNFLAGFVILLLLQVYRRSRGVAVLLSGESALLLNVTEGFTDCVNCGQRLRRESSQIQFVGSRGRLREGL